MPNAPKTPITAVRLPPDLKARAARRARKEGRTLTDVIVAKLREYVAED